jgi:hypothetical protein
MSGTVGGYNPLRHSCEEDGCYNVKHRPKIEFFAGALPGKIAMTDVDATTEVNGHFLFLEFKSGEPRDIPMGQRIYFQRLTGLSDRITCVVVCGDAETMSITHTLVIHAGRLRKWEPCDLEGLFERVQRWASKTKLQVVRQAA